MCWLLYGYTLPLQVAEMSATSRSTLNLDVKNAIMFPPKLRAKVVEALASHPHVRANTQGTPAIGVRINSRQYWLSEWEFTS